MSAAKAVPLTCHGHSRPVTHLSFSSLIGEDQYFLISACKDNNPMLRDGVTGDWIGTFIGHKGAVWQSRLTSTGTYAATASADFTAKVWDTETGECLSTLQHQHIVRSVAFAPGPSPQIVATGGFEKKLRLWDVERSRTGGAASPPIPDPANPGAVGAASREIGAGVHEGTIKSIIWGPDQNMIITAADDKKVRWWDLRTESPVSTFTLDGPLGSCEMSTIPSEKGASGAVLSVGAGKTAYFFSGSSPGQLLKSHKTKHEISALATNFDENRFVTGSSGDTWVRVFDYDTAEELNVHKGHHGPVWSTSFSPDGKLYATGSEDGTVKLWKFTNDGYGLWK